MFAVKQLLPYLIGAVIAAVLYVYPDARAIGCGAGFTLPFVSAWVREV